MTVVDKRTEAAVAKMRDKIESGAHAALVASATQANEHITGYPDWQVRSADYARVVQVLGAYAAGGDRNADAAAAILSRISPNLGERQMMKQIALEIRRLAMSDWDDVRFRTGPESVRRSEAMKPPTYRTRLSLAVLWQELNAENAPDGWGKKEVRLGWVMKALLEQEHVVPGVSVGNWAPMVADALNK
jgi:hypothetical protein